MTTISLPCQPASKLCPIRGSSRIQAVATLVSHIMPEEMLGEVDRRPGATEAEEAAEAEEAEVPEDRVTPATPTTPSGPRFAWPVGRMAG